MGGMGHDINKLAHYIYVPSTYDCMEVKNTMLPQ